MNISRRKFLKQLGLGAAAGAGWSLFGSNLAWAANSCEDTRKTLLIVHLSGGAHSLSVLPPRSLQEYFDKHPDVGIRDSFDLNGQVGLHPALVNMNGFFRGTLPNLTEVGVSLFNQVGFLNLQGKDTTSRSHEYGTQQYAAGLSNPYGSISSGWVGRFAANYCQGSKSIFNFATIGGVARTLASQGVTPIKVSSLSRYTSTADAFGGGAAPTVSSASTERFVRDAVLAANDALGAPTNLHAAGFREAGETAADALDVISQVRTRYTAPPAGTYTNGNPLNQAFMDCAALINSWDLTKVSVVCLSQGGYDTHSGQGSTAKDVNGAFTGGLARLLSNLDGGIGGFFKDLRNRNLHQNVAVLVVSEFGRTFQNQNKDDQGRSVPGTDHGTGGFAALIGHRVRNAVQYANYTPAHFTSAANWIKSEIDVRSIYASVLEQHLGVDSAPIFPDQYLRTNFALM